MTAPNETGVQQFQLNCCTVADHIPLRWIIETGDGEVQFVVAA
jgi:hypothetical protein